MCNCVNVYVYADSRARPSKMHRPVVTTVGYAAELWQHFSLMFTKYGLKRCSLCAQIRASDLTFTNEMYDNAQNIKSSDPLFV